MSDKETINVVISGGSHAQRCALRSFIHDQLKDRSPIQVQVLTDASDLLFAGRIDHPGAFENAKVVLDYGPGHVNAGNTDSIKDYATRMLEATTFKEVP